MSLKILSIDYGDKKVGLALSVSGTKIVKPLYTIPNQNDLEDRIAALVHTEGIDTIVVGLPRNLKGAETAQTKLCRAFAQKLSRSIALPVVLQDEAVTSLQAEILLKSSGEEYTNEDVDALSAALIGQDYMENL